MALGNGEAGVDCAVEVSCLEKKYRTGWLKSDSKEQGLVMKTN